MDEIDKKIQELRLKAADCFKEGYKYQHEVETLESIKYNTDKFLHKYIKVTHKNVDEVITSEQYIYVFHIDKSIPKNCYLIGPCITIDNPEEDEPNYTYEVINFRVTALNYDYIDILEDDEIKTVINYYINYIYERFKIEL